MKTLVYNGRRDVTIKDVPDARVEQPTDVLVRITTTTCGSDLHMYEGRTGLEHGPVARDPRRARLARRWRGRGTPRCTMLPALRRRPEPARWSTVGDAADLMRVRADEPLTIEMVARTVELPVRALHAGFRRELDRSPKQHLQQVRPERARADLVAAEPGAGPRVIDIAYRWGSATPAGSC